MYQQVITNNDSLIFVTNDWNQNVKALLTPNVMFVNQLETINHHNYYKLVVWFDYQTNQKQVVVKEDLLINNLRFELDLNHDQQLETQAKDKLWINFDEEQRRIVTSDQEYFVYLIDERFVNSEELTLNYKLRFDRSNNPDFLNENHVGQNQGQIVVNLKSMLIENIVERPLVTVFLANDTWDHKQTVVYEVLAKKYQLTPTTLSYVNPNQAKVLTINTQTRQENSLAILSQPFLKKMITEVEHWSKTNNFALESVTLKADERLTNYYEATNLESIVEKQDNEEQVLLTSPWNFDYDQQKVVLNDRNQLVFNPLVKSKQWIELQFSLSGKPFLLTVNITQNNEVSLVDQARLQPYFHGEDFHFATTEKLTYLNYSRVLNEYS